MTDREKLREKLIELLSDTWRADSYEEIADHLIENGVTFKQGGWIPVSLGFLPEEDGKYLCFSKGAFGSWIQTVRFATDARKYDEYTFKKRWKNKWLKYDSEYGYYAVDTVTHWMPLPEPPKGGS